MLFVVVLISFLGLGAFGYVPNLLSPPSLALFKLDNYDSSVRPPGLSYYYNEEACQVTVNMFLRQIESYDVNANTIKIQLTLREEWVDTRLAFINATDVNTISINDVDFFWKPDIFFSNEREAHWHGLMKPNVFARISSSGKIMLSSRITLTLECTGQSFGMLSYICYIRMASYGYTTRDVELMWKQESDPIQHSASFGTGELTLVHSSTGDCTSTTATGDYGCLVSTLYFSRTIIPYVVHIVLPTLILSSVSMTTFWLTADPASRIIATSAITLAMTFFNIHQKTAWQIPTFSLLDIWMSLNATFIYGVFSQCIYVVHCLSNSKSKNKVSDDPEGKTVSDTYKKTERIDAVARKAFMFSYLAIVVVPIVVLFFESLFI